MQIKLEIKPLEWREDIYGVTYSHGLNCEYRISKSKLDDRFDCVILNSQWESFTMDKVEMIKEECEKIHVIMVKSHFRNLTKMFIENDIKFI